MDDEEKEYSNLPEQSEVAPPCSVFAVISGCVLVLVALFAFLSQFLKDIP